MTLKTAVDDGSTEPPGTESPHPKVRRDWLALLSEPILTPEVPIVDAHHHLWDRPGDRYMLPDLIDDLGSGHNVQATVFVQCGSMYRTAGPASLRPLGEVEFALGVNAGAATQACPTQICAGIVGFADLQLGDDVQPVLTQMKEVGGAHLKGIRHLAAWDESPFLRNMTLAPPPHLLARPEFRAGFRHLRAFDLSFDAWVFHTQLAELVELARAFPDTSIIVNHLGGPVAIGPYAASQHDAFRYWRSGIAELARCENVVMKVGGFGIYTTGFNFHLGLVPPGSQELAARWRPHFEVCVEAFGPRRCMFESNFPVDKSSCSYPILWNAFKRLAAEYTADERHAMFNGTARRAYKLGEQ